ncbi:dethiobiotin synthase [Phormidium sp. CCY1219]|uniref:dethiobiotin synthase n=1 Tax=Phormidium sp. CCY1219 TaxID=2886104 RepID=UPI002D1EF476|nr:dethiobiotin synthase [Phormidium sp. CCY1219]MEB3829482.1 dethiobiotin synthase [Phormidium sp. CCY1219]
MNALLITGTDTDAGKTVLTCAIAAYWQKYCSNRPLGMMKPIQSGTGDRELYQRLFDLNQSQEEITPLYFQAPLAPPIAAEREGRSIEVQKLWPVFTTLRQRSALVLVEALGGLGSPITDELTVADLGRDWQIPAVLVVPVRLGAISAAVAHVALARQVGVPLCGIVLNCVQPRSPQQIDDWTPIAAIESFTQTPVLGILPHLADSTDLDALAKAASDLDLERLMPFKNIPY